MQKSDHIPFMTRALELALNGIGNVSPNPLVGCVIVHQDRIIGEGWHKKYGGPHAEVNAVDSVKDKSLLPESTVYVSLEPCFHFGKTPPCCDLLISHNVKHVVICNTDINPKVQGKSIDKIREAGLEVTEGVLSEEGAKLNKRFFTAFEKKRPYIILKWAQTKDGFIARKNFDSKWISNQYSRQLVHKWRSEEPAILVGMNTAKYDNPCLNVRDWQGNNPVRIVIDHKLQLSNDLNLFDNSQETLCYNLVKAEEMDRNSYVKLEEDAFLDNMLSDVLQKGINSILIEGGAHTLNQFILRNLWDEARVFIGDTSFGSGIESPKLNVPYVEEIIHGDKLLTYTNQKR